MIDLDDARAVNDLFETIDRDVLDVHAGISAAVNLPTNRLFSTTISVRSLSPLYQPSGDETIAKLKTIVRTAWEQGFELTGTHPGQNDYLVWMRRGCFELAIIAPAWVADHEPLLTFEPREAVPA